VLVIANQHGIARKGADDGQVPYAGWTWRPHI
jgi:hypothetical protein